MIPPSTQYLAKISFPAVNEPKFTRNTSLFRITMLIEYEQQLTGNTEMTWLLLDKKLN